MKATFPESSRCPLANICETTGGQAPCGTLLEHLPPLVPAEDLCLNAVAGRLRQEKQFESEFENDLKQRDVRVAWLTLEQGMPPLVNKAVAEDCFDDADIYAERLIHRTDLPFNFFMNAALLKAHLPSFRARRDGTLPNEIERRQIVETTATLGQLAQNAAIHTQRTHFGHFGQPDHAPCFDSEQQRRGTVVKLSAMLLATRTGLTIYPSSSRESGAVGGYDKPNVSYSHDFYTFTDDQRKVPLKFKTGGKGSHNYGQSLLQISFEGFVNSAAAEQKLLNGARRKTYPDLAIDWLTDEALGQPLNPVQQKLLDTLSHNLRLRIKAFTDMFN